MIAAADGSLHWLDTSGALIDRYDTGVELAGAAMTNSAEGAILLVSSSDQIAAWQVTPTASSLELPAASQVKQATPLTLLE